MSNYAAIIAQNLEKLFAENLQERASAMQAQNQAETLILPAFGALYELNRSGVSVQGEAETGPKGIIISLYALHASADECVLQPMKAFKELPDSMPYAGAFANRTEQALVPVVERIATGQDKIFASMQGTPAPQGISGDFAFVVHPLPKIALGYVFYRADEDFPPSVTCLYSQNAHCFMPTDGLADVGEYTSRKILELIK
jgi:hypothetical protein